MAGSHRETVRSALSYFGVGAAGALAYVVLSTALVTFTDVSPWAGSLLVYAGLILPVYLAQYRLAFRSRQAHRTSFPRYVMIQVFGMLLAAGLPRLLTGISDVTPGIIFAAVAIAIAVTNYSLARFWAFAMR